ncbi:lasso peptide biosynthesis B2 protein [Brevundimonas sp. FT23042]|uniref:lasso peptide biosynthesis B2 protein n=1 Tax=Brevundimonas sp. FT23042 TaxID=3393749 RepID=UPI003B58803F
MTELASEQRAVLLPHIHAARVGSDLILLDLEADDYLCLPRCGSLTIGGEWVSGPLQDLLILSAEELVSPRDLGDGRRKPPALPGAALAPSIPVRPGIGDFVTFFALWADAVRARPSIQTLARRFERRSGHRDDLPAIAARVEMFRQLLPLAPWTGACLFQSELLLRFLNAGGLDADWVFGVRTWPFLAHCWLQAGDHCVSQAPETLSIYRPIMVV